MQGFQSGDQVDKYRILRPLAAGGTGQVYEAEHGFLGRRVALKCLHVHHAHREDVQRRMRAEAIVLAEIRHANVVTVHDAGMADGLVWIAMDLLDGRTLRDILNTTGRIPIPEALYIAAEIADGVEAAHEMGVVHRDLKPENVFMTDGNEVKVLDLGTAKFYGFGFNTTDVRKVPGTIAYMSPEQLRGETVTPQSDVYALGLVTYELIAGHHAFAKEGTNRKLPGSAEMGTLQMLTMPPTLSDAVPGVPESVAELVQSAIAKEASARPGSMREMASRLRDVRHEIVKTSREQGLAPDYRISRSVAPSAPAPRPASSSSHKTPGAMVTDSARPSRPGGVTLSVPLALGLGAVLAAPVVFWMALTRSPEVDPPRTATPAADAPIPDAPPEKAPVAEAEEDADEAPVSPDAGNPAEGELEAEPQAAAPLPTPAPAAPPPAKLQPAPPVQPRKAAPRPKPPAKPGKVQLPASGI